MSSIFSKIVEGEIPCYKIAENKTHLAFLDAFPMVKGHTLVVPKKETDKIFDLPPEEYNALMDFSYKIAKAIEKAVPCLRVGMAVQGLVVPHVHVHLVPLNSTKDMDFSNELQLTEEEFVKIQEEIKSFL